MTETTWTQAEIDKIEKWRGEWWQQGYAIETLGERLVRRLKSRTDTLEVLGIDGSVYPSASALFVDRDRHCFHRLRDDFRPTAEPVVEYLVLRDNGDKHSFRGYKIANDSAIERIGSCGRTEECNYIHSPTANRYRPATEAEYEATKRPSTRPITAEELTAAIAAIPREVEV